MTAHWTETAEWYGGASHFICGPWCRFHLATIVGAHGQRFLVSTVGEYFRRTGMSESDEKLETVGYRHPNDDAFYETMVFPVGDVRCSAPDCNCGQPEAEAWRELACERYALRGDATPPPAAAELAPAQSRFRVRLKQTEGPRSRSLEIAADSADEARVRALADVGSGWEAIAAEAIA